MYKCQICGKEYSDTAFKSGKLSRHIESIHKMTIKEYYDIYLKVPNEDVCPICGKPNKFKGINKKYTKYCSVSCSRHDPELIARQKQTCLAKYGVEHPSKAKTVKEKRKATCRDKYGVDYAIQAKVVRDKIRKTFNNRYNVDNCSQIPEVKKKKEETHILHYGTKNNFEISNIREKAIKNAQSELAIHKRKQTCLNKYGVNNVLANPTIHSKGIEKAKESIVNTKRKNNTFNKSHIEDKMYFKLIEIFGINEVIRNYKSAKYPFLCDFYVKSLNLYIELNIHWTHGKHWFDSTNKNDLDILNVWKEKAKVSKFYENAIDTWTKRDIHKRNTAISNKLNYVVLWNENDINKFVKSYLIYKGGIYVVQRIFKVSPSIDSDTRWKIEDVSSGIILDLPKVCFDDLNTGKYIKGMDMLNKIDTVQIALAGVTDSLNIVDMYSFKFRSVLKTFNLKKNDTIDDTISDFMHSVKEYESYHTIYMDRDKAGDDKSIHAYIKTPNDGTLRCIFDKSIRLNAKRNNIKYWVFDYKIDSGSNGGKFVRPLGGPPEEIM